MLHKLPTEIILSVSSFLNFQDKLSLNATCKKLNDLISKTTLYEHMDLKLSSAEINEIIQQFETNRVKGAQVKILEIGKVQTKMLPRLSRIFPNVTRFTVVPHDNGRAYKPYPMSEPLATWIKTLEVYKGRRDWFPIWRTLKRHTFPRLIELEIEEDEELDALTLLNKKTGFDGLYLLPYIKHAPFLKKLAIRECGLTLDVLEQLHKISPHIQALTLDRNMFKLESDALPEQIVPASSVLYLEISDMVCFDRNGLLIDYILKKYTNLQHLCFTVRNDERFVMEMLGIYYPGAWRYLNHNSTEMENGSGIKRDEYLALISSYESALEIYGSSALKFFSNLPKSITSLKVGFAAHRNIMEVLSRSDMKLVKLEVEGFFGSHIGKLEKPSQLTYIKNLTSLKTMDMTLNSSVQTLNLDLISTSITKVVIHTFEGRHRIDWLLSVFPSLEYICLTGSGSIIGGLSNGSPKKISPKLRKIKMHNILVQPGIFEYIKLAAPNVKELDLEIGYIVVPKMMEAVHTLDVSGWNLEKFSLYFYIPLSASTSRDCKITIENITKRYIVCLKKNTIMLPTQGFNFRTLKNTVRLDVKCDNIKQIKVHGAWIKKIEDEIVIVL